MLILVVNVIYFYRLKRESAISLTVSLIMIVDSVLAIDFNNIRL